jgi:hypothetical protein
LSLPLIDSPHRILFGEGIELVGDKCLFRSVDILKMNIQKQNTLIFIHTGFTLQIPRAFGIIIKR